MGNTRNIALIPAYNEEKNIRETLDNIPDMIDEIIIVDDGSKDNTILEIDKVNGNITILRHKSNQGKGKALTTGFMYILESHSSIELESTLIVLLDGDGQMDSTYIAQIVEFMEINHASFVKGSRFLSVGSSKEMPLFRKIGNRILRYLNRISTGHWNITDPQNGYIALRADILEQLNFNKLDNGYYIENSLLHQLKLHEIKIHEFPMKAIYNIGEDSDINYLHFIPTVSSKLFIDWIKRLYLTKTNNNLRFLSFITFLLGFTVSTVFLLDIIVSIFSSSYYLFAFPIFILLSFYFDYLDDRKN